jgi:PhnB protein
MNQLTLYLMFNGNCKEALAFYENCLGGKTSLLQTFEDSPLDVSAEFKQKVFNAEFRAENITLMASDSLPPYKIVTGNNFALFMNFPEKETLEKVFAKLSKGGKIIMPFENNFGMLVDKFGIQWMLNFREVKPDK